MKVRDEGVSVCDAEQAVFKASHEDVGAYLLGLWGVSDAIVEAVAYHHRPGERCQEGFSLLAAVHVANALEEAGDSSMVGGCPTPVDHAYLNGCELTKLLPLWQAAAGHPPVGESTVAPART